MRDVLINWLRFDTSIFHDSFPASESNVRRVILELERFPGCYVRTTDSFMVDKVAEWVRINAAPFAERMEPPPFIDTPLPVELEEMTVAPPGEPPGESELRQIHIESSVWDKVDVVAAAGEVEDDGNSPLLADEGPRVEIPAEGGEWSEEVPLAEIVGGDESLAEAEDFFSQGEAPALQKEVRAEEGESFDEGESLPAEEVVGHRQDAGTAEYLRGDGGETEGVEEEELDLPGVVVEEVNTSLEATFAEADEAVQALGSAYRGLKEGLARLVAEVAELTGRELGAVKDPGLQMEAVRGAVRKVVESLREKLQARSTEEEAQEAAKEGERLKGEVQKLRGVLEKQFEVTTQIRGAWKKIMEQKKAKPPPRKTAARRTRKATKKR